MCQKVVTCLTTFSTVLLLLQYFCNSDLTVLFQYGLQATTVVVGMMAIT